MYLRILFSFTALIISAPLLAIPHEIKTLEHYNKAFTSNKPMVTMYTSAHCGPCKSMKPRLAKLAAQHPDIHFCIIDTGNPALKKITKQWNIRSVPTLIFSHKGEKLFDEIGSMGTKDLEQSIANFRYEMSKISSANKEKAKKTTKKKVSKKQKENK